VAAHETKTAAALQSELLRQNQSFQHEQKATAEIGEALRRPSVAELLMPL
jgi:hypothetical protein